LRFAILSAFDQFAKVRSCLLELPGGGHDDLFSVQNISIICK
jgi:hypothetical protein